MNIRIYGQRFEDGIALSAEKRGEALILNGVEYDFSPLLEGATLPVQAISSEWFIGDATREGGVLTLHVRYPIPANFSPEQATPRDLVDLPDGPVAFPQALPDPDPAEQGVDHE
ncbi:hypothetical protein [Pseudomonas sp. AL03]|uniref:hypothetical protein n=1 Tax=Pseudomonas sp. AL03 TaxID=3042230 RepID=UPI00249A8ED4|nr:hypothetical protein [Pseudomonas sp. AL03]MDI3274888.1 hypothetical protein [Pseudomonas sp. AL03]